MKYLIFLISLSFATNMFAHSLHYHRPPLKNQVVGHASENLPPLEIIKEGHPTLRKTAEPVTEAELADEEFQGFLDDLTKTMRSAGGVGLAAPQVNVSKRIFVMGGPYTGIPITHVINPEVTYFEEKGMKQSTEGCLSIPGRRFSVPRYRELQIDYFDRDGQFISEEVDGFKAIVIQHEFDHLEGILISDFTEEIFTDEYVPQM